MKQLVFLLSFFVFNMGFGQNPGCVFLEGLELPCFGGGVACGGCSDYFPPGTNFDDMCYGTPVPPENIPEGCPSIRCGNKCCASCPNFNPADYYTCHSFGQGCDENGNSISCGQGTKRLSCEDRVCQEQAAQHCGSFTCRDGCASVSCDGGRETITCYKWSSITVSSGGTCGCRNVGGSQGECLGFWTGGVECGTQGSDPCRGSSQSQCNAGNSPNCWSCNWQSGSTGTNQAVCDTGAVGCYANPVEVRICSDTCSGFAITDSPDNSPGRACTDVEVGECRQASDCPACP